MGRTYVARGDIEKVKDLRAVTIFDYDQRHDQYLVDIDELKAAIKASDGYQQAVRQRAGLQPFFTRNDSTGPLKKQSELELLKSFMQYPGDSVYDKLQSETNDWLNSWRH